MPKTTPFRWGRIDPKPVPNWTHSFWPHFWGQSNSLHFTLYIPTLLHSFLPTPQPSCPYLLACALSPSLLEYRPFSQSHSYTPACVPSILKFNAHSCPTILRSFTPYSTSPLTIIDQPAFLFACLVHFFFLS